MQRLCQVHFLSLDENNRHIRKSIRDQLAGHFGGDLVLNPVVLKLNEDTTSNCRELLSEVVQCAVLSLGNAVNDDVVLEILM